MGFDPGGKLMIGGVRYRRSSWFHRDYFTQRLGQQDSSQSVHEPKYPRPNANADEVRCRKDKSLGIPLPGRPTLPKTKGGAPFQGLSASSSEEATRAG